MQDIKTTLVLTILFLLATPLLAQTDIIGYVVDETGQPLTGATVSIYEKDVFKAGDVTDKFGQFSIDEKEFDEIIVRYLGYTNRKITQHEIAADNWVVLKPDGILLDEIVIRAYNPRNRRGCGGCCYPIKVEATKDTVIVETANYQTLSFFPNPTRNLIRVTLEEESTGVIEIINTSGAVLDNFSFSGITVDIDLNRYPAGTYILRHFNKEDVYMVGKVIKIE